MAYAFRNTQHPLLYGSSALVAMLHDVLVVLGVFSILGLLFNVQIDALFITALLTVIGFSVHDTIVVFDRIRENLAKHPDESFEADRRLLAGANDRPFAEHVVDRHIHALGAGALWRRIDSFVCPGAADRDRQWYVLVDFQCEPAACCLGEWRDPAPLPAVHTSQS